MASAITSIYAALAAIDITLDGAVVEAKSLSDLPNKVDTEALPIRLLLPFGVVTQGEAARGPSFQLTAIDDMSNMRWRIDDVLLYKFVGSGYGLASAAPGLVAYVAAYAAALRLNRTLTPQSRILGVNYQVQPVEWPEGSGNWFQAVVCTVEIAETFRYA